jgi:hypothetical protein
MRRLVPSAWSIRFSTPMLSAPLRLVRCQATDAAGNPALEIAKLVHQSGGSLALGKVIHGVSATTKQAIMRSGKGLEGFVRQYEALLDVKVVGGEKRVFLNDTELFPPIQAAPVAPILKSSNADNDTASSPSQATSVDTDAARAPPSLVKEVPNDTSVEQQRLDTTAQTAQPTESPEVPPPAEEAAQPTPALSPDTQRGAATQHPAPASRGLNTASAQESAQRPLSPASLDAPVDEDMTAALQENPEDPNFETRRHVLRLLPTADVWYNANEVHNKIFRGSNAVPYDDFVLYLRGSPEYFWYHKGTVARRLKKQGETAPAKHPLLVVSMENLKRGFVNPDGTPNMTVVNTSLGGSAPKATTPNISPTSAGSSTSAAAASGTSATEGPCTANNFLGWGGAFNVPTSADVYEILKYVPIHWTNMGNLVIPPDVKKRHVRVSSVLAWFSRQPRYFDVRVSAGTIEVRRSVVLHPEAHNLTKEEAEALVLKRIEADREAGEPLPMKLAREVPTGKKPISSPTIDAAIQASHSGVTSASQDAVTKILLRVCPGYFITTESIIRRATKRLEVADIASAAERNPNIDMITVTSKAQSKVSKTFLRRKTGLEASKWEVGFIQELENSENLELLTSCMTRGCAQWDRLHFLYVRLPDEDKIAIGGFDGMTAFLKAHPHVFVVGEYFFKRVDSSDPNFDTTEPTSNDVTSTKQLEDNPYQLSKELAMVFNYLVPEDQPCSMSHFVECCSPAMRSVLPPRLITVVQSHPELLSYREVSPGTYAVSRTVADDGTMPSLTSEETVAEIVKLVPPRGIDASHLMSTLPPPLHAAVVSHFGKDGVHELVNRHMHLFHVVRNPPYVTLFLKKPRRQQ